MQRAPRKSATRHEKRERSGSSPRGSVRRQEREIRKFVVTEQRLPRGSHRPPVQPRGKRADQVAQNQRLAEDRHRAETAHGGGGMMIRGVLQSPRPRGQFPARSVGGPRAAGGEGVSAWVPRVIVGERLREVLGCVSRESTRPRTRRRSRCRHRPPRGPRIGTSAFRPCRGRIQLTSDLLLTHGAPTWRAIQQQPFEARRRATGLGPTSVASSEVLGS